MRIGIHQPHYFPWIGYFDKMIKSDIFILLDDVQMEKGSYMYRNRILNTNGEIIYLTISGDKHGYLERKYRELSSTNDEIWLNKHAQNINRSYGESPFFNEVWNEIGPLFKTKEKTICDYCVRSLVKIKDLLDIPSRVQMQSDLHIDETKKKNDLIINICKSVGATHYLSGNGARKYTDEKSFSDEGIVLQYQDFKVPEYEQIHNNEFVPGLSILDMLFNIGIEKTKEVLWAKAHNQ